MPRRYNSKIGVLSSDIMIVEGRNERNLESRRYTCIERDSFNDRRNVLRHTKRINDDS